MLKSAVRSETQNSSDGVWQHPHESVHFYVQPLRQHRPVPLQRHSADGPLFAAVQPALFSD